MLGQGLDSWVASETLHLGQAYPAWFYHLHSSTGNSDATSSLFRRPCGGLWLRSVPHQLQDSWDRRGHRNLDFRQHCSGTQTTGWAWGHDMVNVP